MSHYCKKIGSLNAKTHTGTTSPNQEPFEIKKIYLQMMYDSSIYNHYNAKIVDISAALFALSFSIFELICHFEEGV